MARADLEVDRLNGNERHRRSKSLRSQIDNWLDRVEQLEPSAEHGTTANDHVLGNDARRSRNRGDTDGAVSDAGDEAERVAAEPSEHLAATHGERRVANARDGAQVSDPVERGSAGRHSVIVSGSDARGEQVVLARDGERFRHLGAVMPRGAAAPTLSSYLEMGLSGDQAAAIEFVASWFGRPFDAVNTEDDRRPQALTWGIWSVAGRRLARCLADWKQRAPQAFDGILVRYGIDVAVQPDGASTLTVALPRGGYVLGGQPAIDVIASNAALVAALARAGRESTAQLAQIANVAATLPPLLALPLRPGGPPVGEMATSARGLAVMLYLGRTFGRRSTARLIRALGVPETPVEDEGAVLALVVDHLQAVDRSSDAHHVLRILSSPELDTRR